MWILGIIFLACAVATFFCIFKPPIPKEGQKPRTKKQYAISGTVYLVLSLVFFSMSGSNDEPKETTAPAKQEQAAKEQGSSKINVQLDVTPNIENGKVSFTGTTNLPDATELMVSLSNDNGYSAQSNTTVSNNAFKTEVFSDKDKPLAPGKYTVEVTMPIANTQPENVKAVIGDNASNLEGALVTDGNLGRTVTMTKSFEVPGTKTTSEKQANGTLPKQITKAGGLGDTYDAFVQNYGVNAGDQTLASFQNGYVLPLFADGRAMNVKLQFESTPQPRRGKEEALILAKGIIPTDAKKVKEYSDEPGRKIIEYTSQQLAKVMGKDAFGSAKPGTFIVIIRSDDQGVFAVTVGSGNNP